MAPASCVYSYCTPHTTNDGSLGKSIQQLLGKKSTRKTAELISPTSQTSQFQDQQTEKQLFSVQHQAVQYLQQANYMLTTVEYSPYVQ